MSFIKGIPFDIYREQFMEIWIACMKEGYASQDAREYAELEMDAKIRKFRNSQGIAIKLDAKKEKET